MVEAMAGETPLSLQMEGERPDFMVIDPSYIVLIPREMRKS